MFSNNFGILVVFIRTANPPSWSTATESSPRMTYAGLTRFKILSVFFLLKKKERNRMKEKSDEPNFAESWQVRIKLIKIVRFQSHL